MCCAFFHSRIKSIQLRQAQGKSHEINGKMREINETKNYRTIEMQLILREYRNYRSLGNNTKAVYRRCTILK